MNDDRVEEPEKRQVLWVKESLLFNGTIPKNVPNDGLARLNHAPAKLIAQTFAFVESI